MEPALADLRDVADNGTLALVWRRAYGCARARTSASLLNEALEISRDEGLESGIAASTQGLGWTHALLGNHSVALALGAESAARFAELSDREGVSLWAR